MHHLVVAVLSSLLVQSAMAASYTVDKDHSSINFTVKHLGISNVKGHFKDYDGKINFDAKNPKADSATLTIKTASISTESDKRDEHLQSPDFFDTAKFPEMSFKTTKITKSGSKYNVEGLLTLHGVEKPVTLNAEFGGMTKDPWGNNRVAFTASGKIDRTQFGLTWNKPLEKAGALMVGNDVTLNLEIEAIQDKDGAAEPKKDSKG
jgi:polyisoprenoid-binding protein YceI